MWRCYIWKFGFHQRAPVCKKAKKGFPKIDPAPGIVHRSSNPRRSARCYVHTRVVGVRPARSVGLKNAGDARGASRSALGAPRAKRRCVASRAAARRPRRTPHGEARHVTSGSAPLGSACSAPLGSRRSGRSPLGSRCAAHVAVRRSALSASCGMLRERRASARLATLRRSARGVRPLGSPLTDRLAGRRRSTRDAPLGLRRASAICSVPK